MTRIAMLDEFDPDGAEKRRKLRERVAKCRAKKKKAFQAAVTTALPRNAAKASPSRSARGELASAAKRYTERYGNAVSPHSPLPTRTPRERTPSGLRPLSAGAAQGLQQQLSLWLGLAFLAASWVIVLMRWPQRGGAVATDAH